MKKLRIRISPEHHRRAAEAQERQSASTKNYIPITARCVMAQALRDIARKPSSVRVAYSSALLDGHHYKFSDALVEHVAFWTVHQEENPRTRYYTITEIN